MSDDVPETFPELEFLRLAEQQVHAQRSGQQSRAQRAMAPEDILRRYALAYIEDPEEAVSEVMSFLRRADIPCSQESAELFLLKNANAHAASFALDARKARYPVPPGTLTKDHKIGDTAGAATNRYRKLPAFLEREVCQELLDNPEFASRIENVPQELVSLYVLCELLNLSPTDVLKMETGVTGVPPEIADGLIEIFGFEQVEKFKNLPDVEEAPPSTEITLFQTPLFDAMRENLRVFLEPSKVYMGDGTSELLVPQLETLQQISSFLNTPAGGRFSVTEFRADKDSGGWVSERKEREKKGQFLEVVAATGTGKTGSFGAMATAMNGDIEAEVGSRLQKLNVPALILTPRQLLNAQTKKEFCEKHGVDEKDVVIYDANQGVRERNRLFLQKTPPKYLIASYQSLFNLLNEHQLDFTNPDPRNKHYRPLVILDEVQEATGPETRNLITDIFINKVLVTAFTATDAGAAQSLFDGQAPAYQLPIAVALDRGYLCKRLVTGIVPAPLEASEENADMLTRMSAVREGEEYDTLDTGIYARNRSVINRAVDHYLDYYDEEAGHISNLPVIFYTEGAGAAARGAEIFNEKMRQAGQSIRAAYISSNPDIKSLFVDYDRDGNVITLVENRDKILEMFRNGEIQAIWNDSVLEMGIDVPNAAVCYSLKNSRSPHVVEQQLGRITRRGDGNKIAFAFNVCTSGMNPYLYADVLGGYEVTSKEFKEREDRNPSTRTGRPRRDYGRTVPSLAITGGISTYRTREDWQAATPPEPAKPPEPDADALARRERAKAAAAEEEAQLIGRRRQVVRDAQEQLWQRIITDASTSILQTATFAEAIGVLVACRAPGVSINDVGVRLGVPATTLYHWRQGKGRPRSGIAFIEPYMTEIGLSEEAKSHVRELYTSERKEVAGTGGRAYWSAREEARIEQLDPEATLTALAATQTFAAALEKLIETRPPYLSVDDFRIKIGASITGLSFWRNGKVLPGPDKEALIRAYMKEIGLPESIIGHVHTLYTTERRKKLDEQNAARRIIFAQKKEDDALEAQAALTALAGKESADLPTFGTIARWARQAAKLYGPEMVEKVKKEGVQFNISPGLVSFWESDTVLPSKDQLSAYAMVVPAEHFVLLSAAWSVSKKTTELSPVATLRARRRLEQARQRATAKSNRELGTTLGQFITDSGMTRGDIKWRAERQGKLYYLLKGQNSIHLYDEDIYNLFTTLWPADREISAAEVKSIRDFLVKLEPGLVKGAEGEGQLHDWLRKQIEAKNWLYVVFPSFSKEWLDAQPAASRRNALFRDCIAFEGISHREYARVLGVNRVVVDKWAREPGNGGQNFDRGDLGAMIAALKPEEETFANHGRLAEYPEHARLYAVNISRLILEVVLELNTPEGSAFIAQRMESGWSADSFLTTTVPSAFLLALPDEKQAGALLQDLRKAQGLNPRELSKILHYDPQLIRDMEAGTATVDLSKHKPSVIINTFNLFDDRRADAGADADGRYPYCEFKKVMERSQEARKGEGEQKAAKAALAEQQRIAHMNATRGNKKKKAAEDATRELDEEGEKLPLRRIMILIRQELALTQAELGERWGISYGTISGLERDSFISSNRVMTYGELAPARRALLFAAYERETGIDSAEPADKPAPSAASETEVSQAREDVVSGAEEPRRDTENLRTVLDTVTASLPDTDEPITSPAPGAEAPHRDTEVARTDLDVMPAAVMTEYKEIWRAAISQSDENAAELGAHILFAHSELMTHGRHDLTAGELEGIPHKLREECRTARQRGEAVNRTIRTLAAVFPGRRLPVEEEILHALGISQKWTGRRGAPGENETQR